MANITNARDAILQATGQRIVPVILNGSLVDFTQIIGQTRPEENADRTADVLNAGVTVNVVGGGLTLDTAGAVKGGQTGFNAGVGFFLGYADAAYRVSLGDPAGHHLAWDGSTLTLAGTLPYSYLTGAPPANAQNTTDALNAGVTLSSGGVTFYGGQLRAGQTGFHAGSGFFLGWDAALVRVSMGSSASLNYLKWDGAAMEVAGRFKGTVSTGTGRAPDGSAFHVADTGHAYVTHLRGEQVNVSNTGWPDSSAVYGVTLGNSAAVMGVVRSDNSRPYAHGMRGANTYNGAGGVVGAGNGYDFYADGTGTNYGPFTGSHDALAPNAVAIPPGAIVVDTHLVERSGWSSTIFEVEMSSRAKQPGALGVVCAPGVPLSTVVPTAFIEGWAERPPLPHDEGLNPTAVPLVKASYEALKDGYQRLAVNALGEGQVLVCGEGGDLARGDLIVTSSMPGVGMRQADHIVRSVTVARAREAVTFADDEPVAVACIYLCG